MKEGAVWSIEYSELNFEFSLQRLCYQYPVSRQDQNVCSKSAVLIELRLLDNAVALIPQLKNGAIKFKQNIRSECHSESS